MHTTYYMCIYIYIVYIYIYIYVYTLHIYIYIFIMRHVRSHLMGIAYHHVSGDVSVEDLGDKLTDD